MGTEQNLKHGDIDLTPITRVIDFWKEGMVDHEVAEELDLPVHYIAAVRKVLALSANYRHVSTRARRKAARSMAEGGQKAEEIASILKVKAEIVQKWLDAETV
jgi:hypothetical protein